MKAYLKPEFTIVMLESADIIATSGPGAETDPMGGEQ